MSENSKIMLKFETINNPEIRKIIDNLEKENDILKKEIEFVSKYYKALYDFHNDYVNELMRISSSMDTDTKNHDELMRLIRYANIQQMKIGNKHINDFEKIAKINKNNHIIIGLKELDNNLYSDEIINVIKNNV